jgi:hypothetical protein
MTTTIKKSIGAGRDFTTMLAFATWLNTQKLKTDDLIVIGEVYDNMGASVTLAPTDFDVGNYCILRPAPGLSVNDLEPNNPFHYGTSGIELTLPTRYAMNLRPGVILEGFRIKVTYNAPDDTTLSYAILMGRPSPTVATTRPGEIRFCRFNVTTTGANTRTISTAEYGLGGYLRDNLFVHSAGNGLTCSLSYGAIFERNTVVRTGASQGYSSTTGYDNILRDNLFVGCGTVPAVGLPAGAPGTGKVISNNITDTAMTTTHPGFVVAPPGELVEDPLTDVRPKLNSVAIGAASSTGLRTKDMLARYRGNLPDVGAYQRVSQPLPALATAAITSQTITEQTIVVRGTVTGEVISGSAWLTRGGVPVAGVAAVPVQVNTATGTFTATFQYLTGGSYDTPNVNFTNNGGTGPNATGGSAFNITQAVMPGGTILKQYVLGRKVIIKGSVTNAPESGVITLKPAAVPNGAITQGPVPIVVSGNTFTATLAAVPYGDYLAPEIKLTNMAGTSAAIAGGTLLSVTQFVPPVQAGVNIQTIGLGMMHATWKEFVTWIRARDMRANAEMVRAYVFDDQVMVSGDYMRLEPPTGVSAENYCVISPAPGCSVNDFHKTSPFDYGEIGVEIKMSNNAWIAVCPGMKMTGFRISVEQDTPSVVDKSNIFLARVQSATANTPVPEFYNNRIKSKVTGPTNSVVAPAYPSQALAYDNYIVHTAGDAMTFLQGGGTVSRNTVIRQGTAIGGNIAKITNSCTMRDNVFTGASATPVSVAAAAVLTASNNVLNAPLTTPLTGFTVVGELDAVEDLLTDARPKAGGGLINAASATARTTNDIRGENRGPSPDVGAWQRDPFQPTPAATITETRLDGSTLIVRGTVTYNPTSGRGSVAPDSLNPNGASALPEKAITITGNTFEVRWENVLPGNYAAPALRFTNAGGEGPLATGGIFSTVLVFGGNPMATDDAQVVINPKVAITNFVQNGMSYTLEGTFDLMGDGAGKVELYVDPLPDGVSIGPIALVGANGTWRYDGVATLYSAALRVVATAFGNPQVATTSLTVIKASGTPALPRK